MFETLMTLINACADDVLFDGNNGRYDLTFDDFEGFDDNWREIDRDYIHPVEVEALVNWLTENASSINDDYYCTYYFNGFEVTVGYTSMDI